MWTHRTRAQALWSYFSWIRALSLVQFVAGSEKIQFSGLVNMEVIPDLGSEGIPDHLHPAFHRLHENYNQITVGVVLRCIPNHPADSGFKDQMF